MFGGIYYFFEPEYLEDILTRLDKVQFTESLLSANMTVYPIVNECLDRQTMEKWKVFLPEVIEWGNGKNDSYKFHTFSECVKYYTPYGFNPKYQIHLQPADKKLWKSILQPKSLPPFWQEYWYYRTMIFIRYYHPQRMYHLGKQIAKIYSADWTQPTTELQFSHWTKQLKQLNLHFDDTCLPSKNTNWFQVLLDIQTIMYNVWLYISDTIDADQKLSNLFYSCSSPPITTTLSFAHRIPTKTFIFVFFIPSIISV